MKKHSIRHIIESVYATPWAITEGKFSEILAVLDRRDRGQLSAEELQAFGNPLDDEEEEDQGYCMTPGGVAVVPVSGVIAQRMNLISRFSGGCSTEMVGKTIQKCLKNPDCKAIVLDVNSPGGAVGGVAELSNLIFQARGQKPCVAVANTQMASAAYWVASACDEVVASPSSTVGSIGVYMVHSERSQMDKTYGLKRTIISAGKWKAIGNDVEPLTAETRSKLQDFVGAAYSLFVEAVARNRNCSAESVKSGYGEGDVALGRDAVSERLADRVATLNEVISELEARFRAAPGGGPSAQKTVSPIGGKPSTFSTMKGIKMDQKLVAALFAKGLISECNEEAAKAFFAARNETLPSDSAAYISTLFAPTQAAPANPAPQVAETSVDAVADAVVKRLNAQKEAEATYLKTQTAAVCELMGLDAQATTEIVAMGKPLDEARSIVIDRVAGNSNPLPRVEMKTNELENFGKGAQEALDARCLAAAGIAKPEDQPKNNPFSRMRVMELAEHSLRLCGVRTAHLTRAQLAKLALASDNPSIMASVGGSAYYGTGSFASLTLNSMRKTLQRSYEEAPVTWRTWARQGESTPDFKIFSRVKFGEGSDLEEVPEGHDLPTDTGLKDDREYSAVSKYEKVIPFTWEMMVNDDLSALSRLPMMQSRAAARTVNKKVYAILTGNPYMADGYQLFDATNHGTNLQGTGSTTAAPPSVATLQAMQGYMRTQKGINSDALLNLAVRWVIVPAALEVTANTLLRSQTDPALSNANVVNMFYGAVQPVVEPLLDATSTKSWYGVADNSQVDTVEVVFLEGEETPFVETWWEPKNDTRHYKIRQTFVAFPVDYKGLAKHTGYSA